MGNFDMLRAAFVCAFLAVSPPVAAASGEVSSDRSKAEAAMQDFNHAMLSILRRGQTELTAKTRPVMIIARNVTVVSENGEKSYPRDGPGYNELKSVSHVLLGIIGAVTPWPDDEAATTRMTKDFTTIRSEIDSFLAVIDGLDLPKETLAKQRDMLTMAGAFIDRAMKDEDLTRAEVTQAINDMRPVWAANMRDAARTELDSLHRAVSAARKDLDADAWARTYVVSHGGPNVRAVNVVQLYLQRVMPDKVAAGQVLFAVDTHGKDKMIDYAGYTRMQRIVGAWAFGDPKRMEVDLLGYEAGAILDEMIPALPPAEATLD